MKWTFEFFYMGQNLCSGILYSVDAQAAMDAWDKWVKSHGQQKGTHYLWMGPQDRPHYGLVATRVTL